MGNVIGSTGISKANTKALAKEAIYKPSDYVQTVRTFESLDGVTLAANGGGLATMAINGSTLGDNGLPVLKITSNKAVATINVLVDMAGFGEGFNIGDRKDLGIQIKLINSASKISYINMNLSSNSSLTNYYTNSRIQSANLSGDGMYYIPLNDKDFTVGGGTPSTQNLKYLRFNISPLALNGTDTTSFDIEIIRVVKFLNRKSRCMISFDDGHNTCPAIASLLESHSMLATFYIYNAGIDQAGNMTLAQLQALYAKGHDIAVHNDVHSNVGVIGDAAYFAGQQVCRDWIRENIGTRAVNHTAFVGGISTIPLIGMMQRAGFKSTRKATPAQNGYVNAGFGTGLDNKWYSPRWLSNTWEMNDATTVATMITAHQDAINSNQDFFVYGHQLLTTQTAQAWSSVAGNPYSMADYLDWLASKVASGEVEVLTVSQFWDGI